MLHLNRSLDLPKAGHVDTNVPLVDPTDLPILLKPQPIMPLVPEETVHSRRKQRQLEVYMRKKLKKEARPELLEKLQKVSYSGQGLQSTKDLSVPSRREGTKTSAFVSKEETDVRTEETTGSGDDVSDVVDAVSSDNEASFSSASPIPKKRANVRREMIHDEFVDMHAAIASIKRSSLNPLDDDSSEFSSESDKDIKEETKEETKTQEESIEDPSSSFMKLPWKTYFVLVERSAEIQTQRERLPIFAEEQRVMETIRENAVTIICGETGSGKTTQIPQFLYEAGFGDVDSPNPGLIGVTQPRRVAATSMAGRVGVELGRPSDVAYQIRYDGTVSKDTRIKFMTDGILLRELAEDFLLKKYSIILLDEAHERNLNTDILIGMLSRIVRLRNKMALEQAETIKPLRLVIMSATLNIDEFTAPHLFSPVPPIIQVDARQHPVTMHFARKTEDDYVRAAFKTICKIHANLPSGGILVFLTGKQEIVNLANKLNAKYGKWKHERIGRYNEQDDNVEFVKDEDDDFQYGDNDVAESEDNLDPSEETEAEAEAEEQEEDEFSMKAETRDLLHVLPLYSMLAPEEQAKVFLEPPQGSRLCVLATNVAETSITIPNIRYVVDTGLVKERHVDLVSGAQEFRIEWISKASAVQRAGRAGRVGPGHCYRLYSSAVYESHLPDYSTPEIQRTPIEGLVLQLKTMGIDHPERFPLPSSPDFEAIISAQKALLRLGALSKSSVNDQIFSITKLGLKMSRLPLSPLWSRLVVVAMELNIVPVLAIALASVMAVGDPFLDTQSKKDEQEAEEMERDKGQEGQNGDKRDQQHSLNEAKLDLADKPPTGDLVLWLNAFLGYIKAGTGRQSFCQRHHLMAKRMEEMSRQFDLLRRILTPLYPERAPFNLTPSPLNLHESEQIRRLIVQSLSERAAERIKLTMRKRSLPAYRLLSLSEDDPNAIVYLHPTSVVKNFAPKLLVYSELISQAEDVRYVRNVTAIERSWLDS